jgi:hypothetical protein
MKIIIGIALFCAATLAAADKSQIEGPKGGRLLEKTDPKAEFFLEKDRTATIFFYDAKLKPVAASEQVVTLIVNTKEGKETIQFEKKADVLVSKSKLPEGDNYPVIVQLRANPAAKPQNHRFNLDTSACGECKRAEYACACH